MNNVLSLVQAARTSPNPRTFLCSEHMLIELLALNEEMIAQLRHERLEVAGRSDFVTSMIEQHENTAAMLRLKIENEKAATRTGA